MIEYTCKICGKVFQDEKNQGNVSRALLNHIRKEHNISSIYEYILKVYYNNEVPKCKCGCGNDVNWYYKNALFLPNHGFRTYSSCGHVIQTEESIEAARQKQLEKWNNKDLLKEHIQKYISLENLENALNDLKNHITTAEITKKYGIDYRTLLSYWLHLDMITKEEFRNITSINQHVLSSQTRKARCEFLNKEKTCEILYEILYNNPGRFTVNSLITYFNKCHPDLYIHVGPWAITKALQEKYGGELDTYLQYGYHSREEYEFGKVLMYYFSCKNVKIGKTIKYGYKRNKYFIYDICLFNKLIIEYDSIGTFHNDAYAEIRDKEKEDFAIKNGYIFMRLSKDAAKNPETILQIKKLLNIE